MQEDAAERELLLCCGSAAWARRMVAARPFATLDRVLETADAAWGELPEPDQREALNAHPRIGDRKASGREAEEQAGALLAADEDARLLAEANREYESRFGRIFIVCAAGRSAREMLAVCRERLGNDPAKEFRVAAEEQRRITRLRLEKLACGK
ncbi:MAG: 2-oxo-4-hydroxy-4-carboxy-5-ureidoimidazoline decarboxylase, partial [Acidobacteriota bacterium]